MRPAARLFHYAYLVGLSFSSTTWLVFPICSALRQPRARSRRFRRVRKGSDRKSRWLHIREPRAPRPVVLPSRTTQGLGRHTTNASEPTPDRYCLKMRRTLRRWLIAHVERLRASVLNPRSH